MDARYLGDALDYYKRWFLLEACGPLLRDVRVLPMPVEGLSGESLSRYASLLGVGSEAIVQTSAAPRTRSQATRATYFGLPDENRDCDLFLDPNTGFFCNGTWGAKGAANYVLAGDLATLLPERSERLVVIYDQSLGRGSELPTCRSKLIALSSAGFRCLAYCAQVAMLVVATPVGESRLRALHSRVSALSYVPPDRVLTSWCDDR